MEKASDEQDLVYLNKILATFECYLDVDIENFLHTKAIDFLKRGLSATYLLLNYKLFEQNIIKI